MRFYSPNSLFIGEIGNVHTKNSKTLMNEIGYTICKQSEKFSYEYFDIISNATYTNFHSSYLRAGNLAIYEPKPLLICIQKIYDTIQNENIYNIATKIIKLELISEKELNCLIKYFNNKNSFKNNTNRKKNNLTILTNKTFTNEPAVAVNDKLTEIMIVLTLDNKNPILIGYDGVGKNTLIDEIAYKIQKNTCPKLFKGTKIIDITKLITLKNISKSLEKEINKLIKLNIEKKVIFLIKNIDKLYLSNNPCATIIKESIEEYNLKLIGITAPDKCKEFISNNNSNSKFQKIYIEEPTNEALYEIINKIFIDYMKKHNIKLFDNMTFVTNLLIDFTKEENRIWNSNNKNINTDIIYNPGLVTEIIDMIFASAIVHNREKLQFDDLKYGIESCKKIIESAKEEKLQKVTTNDDEFIYRPISLY